MNKQGSVSEKEANKHKEQTSKKDKKQIEI